jgi:anti-sigma-K factor RskA
MEAHETEPSVLDHQKYVRWCALATARSLSAAEISELEQHLAACADCRCAYAQYHALAATAIPLLAKNYHALEDAGTWDNTRVRAHLLAQVAQAPTRRVLPHPARVRGRNRTAMAAMAACLSLALLVTGFWAGRDRVSRSPLVAALDAERARLMTETSVLEARLTEARAAGRTVQNDAELKQTQIAGLQTELGALETRLRKLNASYGKQVERIRALAQERDASVLELRAVQQDYREAQEERGHLRTQHGEAVLRAAALESEVRSLSEQLHNRDRVLEDQQQYLASDRDIRELMGARQLYIADVFDIDNTGRTRKPFGRIFYTRDKSLVFYAFDLDRAPKLKNAGSFQAWGGKDYGAERPLSLGVFYMDNEANRRWVLRFDDPAKLAQINAIFVTVEPNGGSVQPTSKPFLYASLRHLPNHP